MVVVLIKGVFDNLVKFVYKLGKNWKTRAWDPVFKTAESAPDAAMILGLFSHKNLKINSIASPILVTGSVNGSQNMYCVSDYCQRL
jgi:hypothetical protein